MIKKAVITAAGQGTRQYPATNAVQKELFPLVDRDGITKPTIQIIAEQALQTGIEEICIVVNPGEAVQFKRHFNGLSKQDKQFFEKKGKAWALRQSELLDDLKKRIVYVEQREQQGFGHAVWCAKAFVESDPFLLLLGDHVYVSHVETSCMAQTLMRFDQIGKTLFPVVRTPIDRLHLFGTLAGNPVLDSRDLYEVTEIIEKPDPKTAQRSLVTPGLPDNTFFTFFGMYALSSTIMDILDRHVHNKVRSNDEIELTTALKELKDTEGAFALEIQGQRLDMGTPLGYIETQFILTAKGVLVDELKAMIGHHFSHRSKKSF